MGCLNNFSRFWGTGVSLGAWDLCGILEMWIVAWSVRV